MPGPLEIVYEGPDGRIVVADSLTYCDERIQEHDVVVGGSFAARYAGSLPLRYGARAVIANAAGVGKDGSGIGLLPIADELGVPCAAVSEQSARIADGADTYASGVIAHVNQAARALGVVEGQRCAEAARRLLAAPPGQRGRAADLVDARRLVVYDGPEGRVVALPSFSLAGPEDADSVICAGSHTGEVTLRYIGSYAFPVAGVIGGDCGLGKDQAAIGGLEPLARLGIAAAAVSHRSALVGDGRSTYADGVISYANRVAEAAGVRADLPARQAALLMLRAYAARRGSKDG